MSDAELERDLRRLREDYGRRLVGKLAELDASLRGSGGERPGRAELERTREVAHRLKGTSGSYGFVEVSAELERIEEQLDHLLDEALEDSAAVWSELEQALERARAALSPP